MKLGDIEFNEIDRKVKISENHAEFDILLFNGECVGIIEVKSKAHPKDFRPIIEKKIGHFKLDYPDYANPKFYFEIATLVTHPALIQKAREEGIFLLTQKGDHLEFANSEVRAF